MVDLGGYPLRMSGSEFEDWQRVWCDVCVYDHDFSHGPMESGAGCEVVLRGWRGEPVPEWTRAEPFGRIVCEKFSLCHYEACQSACARREANR